MVSRNTYTFCGVVSFVIFTQVLVAFHYQPNVGSVIRSHAIRLYLAMKRNFVGAELYVPDRSVNGTGREIFSACNGGYGNQLFQMASAFGLAKFYQARLFAHAPQLVSVFPNIRKYVDVVSDYRTQQRRSQRRVVEKGFALYTESLWNVSAPRFTPEGYLQSWKYFRDAEEELKDMLQFNSTIRLQVGQRLIEIREKAAREFGVSPLLIRVVGVHVRRGDFASGNRALSGFRVPPAGYFTLARHIMRQAERYVHFAVVSDTFPWARRALNFSDVSFVEGSAPLALAVLAHSDHVIMSVGTFGWWGAWLCEKRSDLARIFYFKEALVKTNHRKSEIHLFSERDHMKPNWTPLSLRDIRVFEKRQINEDRAEV